MADLDEDVIKPPEATAEEEDNDAGEDMTLDYKLLASLNSKDSSLPRRGEKDFEHHNTNLQADTLTSSRRAMYDALDHTRVHAPKNHTIAFYNPSSGRTIVPRNKGNLFRSVGKDLSGGGIELLPEEALWALERGSLDVHYSLSESDDDLKVQNDGDTIPMSLQGAYAAYLSQDSPVASGLTMEKYIVYAGLKRTGYIVLRAEGFQLGPTTSRSFSDVSPATRTWLQWLRDILPNPAASWKSPSVAPSLVHPGIYRTHADVYRMLSIIPNSTAQSLSDAQRALNSSQEPKEAFTTTYDVYKPTPRFKKSDPGPPAFRICVVSARETRLPTLQEIGGLLDEQECDPPTKAAQHKVGIGGVYQRLKHGQRNVIIAVVDQGVVSYMRFAHASFSSEKLYERVTPSARGGKSGSRRGGGNGSRGGRGGKKVK